LDGLEMNKEEGKKQDEGRRRRTMTIVLSPWRVFRAPGDD